MVITSVDRDDLPDGGAQHFARTVELAKMMKPDLKVARNIGLGPSFSSTRANEPSRVLLLLLLLLLPLLS